MPEQEQNVSIGVKCQELRVARDGAAALDQMERVSTNDRMPYWGVQGKTFV